MRIATRSRALFLVATLCLFSFSLACANPSSSTRGVTENPSLVFKNAPEGSVVYVDGLEGGPAVNFSGERSLEVLPGRHVVELRQGGQVIARREVVVDAQGIKEIDFTGAGR